MNEEEDLHVVIANCEDELALWPALHTVPAGWRTIVPSTQRERCLSFVRQLEAERRPSEIRRVLESKLVRP